MEKGKYHGTAGMPMPKKERGPKGPGSVSNGGNMNIGMDGVSTKPTTSKDPSSLKGTTNGKNPGSYGKMKTGKKSY